jgi:hypothetical protein
MDVSKLGSKNAKRGRKPGSGKKVKKLTPDEQFMEAKRKYFEELEQGKGISKLIKDAKVPEQDRYNKKHTQHAVDQAIRRSRILQGLIDTGRIQPKYLFNAIVWEEPKLRMRQIELK